MPKKLVGLVIAAVLALTGQSFAALPATADTAQHLRPTGAYAEKAKPKDKAKAKAKAKAAARAKAAAQAKAIARAKAAAAAKVRAAARARAARDAYVAGSGPRAAAAARAAARARADYAAKVKIAAAWRKQATTLGKAAALARARAAKLPAATKPQAAAKRNAQAMALKSTQNHQRAVVNARKSAAAAVKAKLVSRAQKQAAREARVIYAALAGPRADLTSRQAAAARNRAIAAARAIAPARAKAISTYRAGATARVKSAAANAVEAKITKKTKKSDKKKIRKTAKRAAKIAASLTKAASKAMAAYRGSITVSERARALAQQLGVAAVQAKKAVGPNGSWNPTDSVLFNYPRGSKKRKYALITQLNRAIDATPAGGDIRIAMYLFDIGSVANKLIAAHRRGVSVQILLDDNTTNKWIRKVKRALGTNRKARSFFGVCDHSCMSNGTSTIHAKFYLFSVAGKSKYVSLVSSGNPYSGNTRKSWNNTHTIVRNKTIYDSLNKYFLDMLPDKNDRDYYRVTQNGKYTVYYYPQKIRKSDDLVWMHHLNRVSCRAAPGYGNAKGKTLIRVANWGWTTSRIDVAKRLWKLHNSGCAVQVMVNRARISKGVLKVLLKKSKKHGRMAVYNAWRDWRRKAIAGLYVHHKFATISGPIKGRNVKVILTGSQNFTALGTTANNDLVLRVFDGAMLGQYNTNFAYIRDHYTKRMRKVPLVARVSDRVGGV